MKWLLVQALGFVGFAMFILSYQVKSNKLLYFFQTAANGLFVIHFILLGTPAGGVGSMLTTIRNGMLVKYNDWKWVQWKGWVVVFSIVSITLTALTWKNILSLFAAIGTISSTIAYWTNNARTIRATNLFCASPAWFIHNAGNGSISGAASDAFTMISVIVSIYRFGWNALADNDFDRKKGSENGK